MEVEEADGSSLFLSTTSIVPAEEGKSSSLQSENLLRTDEGIEQAEQESAQESAQEEAECIHVEVQVTSACKGSRGCGGSGSEEVSPEEPAGVLKEDSLCVPEEEPVVEVNNQPGAPHEEDLYNFPASALEMSLQDSQQNSLPAAESLPSALSSAAAQTASQRKSLRIGFDRHGNAIKDADGNVVKEEVPDPCCGLCCDQKFFEKVWDDCCVNGCGTCCGTCGDFLCSLVVCCCTCDNKCNTPVKDFEKRRSLDRTAQGVPQEQVPQPQAMNRGANLVEAPAPLVDETPELDHHQERRRLAANAAESRLAGQHTEQGTNR